MPHAYMQGGTSVLPVPNRTHLALPRAGVIAVRVDGEVCIPAKKYPSLVVVKI